MIGLTWDRSDVEEHTYLGARLVDVSRYEGGESERQQS